MADRVLIGVGNLAIDGAVVENPTTFELEIATEEFSIPYRGGVGGGTYKKKTRISAINWTATVHDYSAAMLARHFRGDVTDVAADAVSNEEQSVIAGGLITTDYMIDVDETVTITHGAGAHATSTAFALGDWIYEGSNLYKVTVAGTTGGTAPTWPTDGSTVVDGTVTWIDMGTFAAVKGTDFSVSAAGITDLAVGMPAGCPIKISYTKRAGEEVNIGTTATTAIPVTFDGYNEEDDTPLVAQLYLNDVAASGGVPIITEGYGGATISGTVLIDSSQPVGKSKYGKVIWGNERVV